MHLSHNSIVFCVLLQGKTTMLFQIIPAIYIQSPVPLPATDTAPIPLPVKATAPIPLPVTDKVLKFGGYITEDAKQLISDFDTYLVLMNISVTDPRAVAAVQVHLQGPTLIWYNALNPSYKKSWTSIKETFITGYCPNDNPAIIAKEATYQNLALGLTQPIEEFHSVIMKKGLRLKK